MTTEPTGPYEPFDQQYWLGNDYPLSTDNPDLQAWEKAHGHDVRLKCYMEFGCLVVEPSLLRQLGKALEETDEMRRWAFDSFAQLGEANTGVIHYADALRELCGAVDIYLAYDYLTPQDHIKLQGALRRARHALEEGYKVSHVE